MRCQKCGCNEFYYTEGIKPKKIKWKLLLILILIPLISVSAKYEGIISNIILALAIIDIFTFVGIWIYEKIESKRTHTKAICAYCRNIEWID